MSIFFGGGKGEIITPESVSKSVGVLGFGRKPSSGSDVIFAGGGDDIVAGGGGNDLAFLGAGDDRFIWNPGDGSDIVEGGSGEDTLEFNGSGVAETIRIDAKGGLAMLTRDVGNVKMTLDSMERIEINAGASADRIVVGDIAKTDVREVAIDLAGAPGATTGDGFIDRVQLQGSNANEVIEVLGEGGSAAVVGQPAAITIRNAEATDELAVLGLGGDDSINATTFSGMALTIDGGDGNDTIVGSAGDDKLLGGMGNDVINGGRGADYVLLGAGDDVFVWNPGDGSDVIDGGTGFDEMTFNGANAGEAVEISANGGSAQFFRDPGAITMDTYGVEVHHFNALGGADSVVVNDLTGTGVQHVGVDLGAVAGGAGDGEQDVITVNGAAADESINIASGDGEILVSGLAAQVHVFGQDADGRDRLVVNGGAGADTIDASALAANAMQLTVNGGQGADTFIGSAGDDRFVWNPGDGSDVIDGRAGVDTMEFNGSDADEIMSINADVDHVMLTRNVGNIRMETLDVERIEIAAGGGEDVVLVNDLVGTSASEVAINLEGAPGEGDGSVDEVQIEGSGSAEFVLITGDASKVSVTGLSVDVTVTAGEAANDRIVIEGYGGRDVIDASSVAANAIQLVVYGGAGDDVILGGAGDDAIFGELGNDVLIGGAGDDLIEGGKGDDVLMGGAGDDVLNGGDGFDVLIGGAGDDVFIAGDSQIGDDLEIQDFVAGAGSEDRIDVRAFDVDFDYLMAHASDSNDGVVLDLGWQQITLRGVKTAELHQDDFLM